MARPSRCGAARLPQRSSSSRAARRRESGGRGRPRRIRRGARVRGQGKRRPGASPRIRRVRGNGGEEEGGDDATQGMQSGGEGLRRWRSGPASRGGRPSGRRHRRGIRGGGIVGGGGVVAIGAARGAVEGEGDGSVRWPGTEPTRAVTCTPGAATGSSPPRSRSGVRGERTWGEGSGGGRVGREPARVRLGVGKESKGGGWAGLVCWAGWAAWVPSWAKRPSGGGGFSFYLPFFVILFFLSLYYCFNFSFTLS